MRRLATLCFPTLLCAISAPAMAANDAVIVFAPRPLKQPKAPPKLRLLLSPLRRRLADDTAAASSKRC
jgi:hypothetical protein